ncbi:MAG TPA: hypothetical protein VIU61_29300 [Kofleriaceae bacterium]
MRPLVLCALLAGCGEKVVEMTLKLPSSDIVSAHDTSCVTAIEVWANGATYPTDSNDSKRDCIEPTAAANYGDIRDEMRGKFELSIPDSGLGGIEIYGYTAPCQVPDTDPNDPIKWELIFYASADYDGSDSIVLPITPNLSCARRPVTTKPLDILKLAAGGATACTVAELPDAMGGVSFGTMSPRPFTTNLDWWGGLTGAPLTNHVATFDAYMQPGADNCVAAFAGNAQLVTMACLANGRNACAPAGTIEVPVINGTVSFASLDTTKTQKYRGAVFGLAWTAAAPAANVTVTVDDPDKENAEVVYMDMPAGVENGTGKLTPLAQQSTNAKGLFMVYTNGFVTITVSNGATSRKVRVGGVADYPAVTLVTL